MVHKEYMSKNFKDILIAGAMGDAYGYCVEFDTYAQITKKYGSGGIQISNVNSWVVSDDTQMTLFCLQAISENINGFNINNDIDLKEINNNIYKNYLDWFETQYISEPKSSLSSFKSMRVKRAPGHTCLSALGSKRCGTMEKPINDSKGCGGIMRVAPIAFLNTSLENIFKLGCMQSAITHGNPEGYLSAGFFAVMLKSAMDGNSFLQSYQSAKDILLTYPNNENMLDYLSIVEESLKDNKKSPDEINESVGLGWTGEEALGVALYSVFAAKDFDHCLWLSANHSGDSDSTASLAGQLYVAFHDLPNNYKTMDSVFDIAEAFQYIVNNLPKNKTLKI
jgi:ADP-ribosyl-[dinitrogen reductase] hydrolase